MFLFSVSVSLLSLTSVFDQLTMRLGEDQLFYSLNLFKVNFKKMSYLVVIKTFLVMFLRCH